ncbi:DUF418 domain-containing protein [Halomicrobium sp. LC1Hm]|uniref:DUF418 domain-containing protein n=1 Tax=Halomicrobium sp. LC1Hm TaxID=2610902 RepID=UPI0012984997|nr:DUF418 domain-containing protein [Halomicrobium sp. LC1Hm]QGA84262.1 Uncharacterized membrane protein, DUF418 family [Halomicrobium sp. LC1Hm]
MSDAATPTPPSDRIVSLDAIRGLAVLGILLINVWVFAMPESVLLNPQTYGDLTGANYWAWLAAHVFAKSKFITLFSALFGAGILLFTDSKRRDGEAAMGLYYRRIGWLLLAGLGHAYLLWYGDVLVAYAFCGLLLVSFRNREPAVLARLGVLFLLAPFATELFAAIAQGPSVIAQQWQPPAATLQQEVATYRSGWLAQMDHRVPTAFRRQTSGFVGATLWRAGGSMFLGMALYRWGVLTGERSTQFYRRLVAVGVVGLLVVLAGVWYIEANDWSADAAMYWRQFNHWGSLLVAGGYVGAVTLYTRWRPTGIVTRTLAAVGRTAFTNYLFQTVLATSIFYGHGLGLFGRLDRVELLGVVVVIWAVQIALSVVWLRFFRFGPVEWCWRTLTYGERQPVWRGE